MGEGIHPAALGSHPPLSSFRRGPPEWRLQGGCWVRCQEHWGGLAGARCCYLPLPLSQRCHDNAGPAGCSSRHIPRHHSHRHASSKEAGAEGQRGLRFSPRLKDHAAHLPPFPPALSLKPAPSLQRSPGLSEGPSGIGELPEGGKGFPLPRMSQEVDTAGEGTSRQCQGSLDNRTGRARG